MKLKIFYGFLKLYSPRTLRIYFKRIKSLNRKNVPGKGAIIFAPNHQNAFMDAVIIGATTPRGPWFLTRASVFKTAMARYWLNALKMLPIYRFRDGLNQVKKNEEIIEGCMKLLSNKESLLIFPEGNHDLKWQLRILQKGITRIAFSTESENNFQLGLKIVPVGLQYEDLTKFRSDVLVNYGEPILMKDFQEIFEKDPLQAYNQFLGELSKRIKRLIVHIDKSLDHDRVKEIIQSSPDRPKELLKRFNHDKKLIEQIEKNDYPEIIKNRSKKRTKFWSIICKIIGFPFFLYGYLNHLPFVLIMKNILKKIKDPNFLASFKYALGIFLVPIGYILQVFIIHLIFHNPLITGIYLVSLPLSGLIAHNYFSHYFKEER